MSMFTCQVQRDTTGIIPDVRNRSALPVLVLRSTQVSVTPGTPDQCCFHGVPLISVCVDLPSLVCLCSCFDALLQQFNVQKIVGALNQSLPEFRLLPGFNSDCRTQRWWKLAPSFSSSDVCCRKTRNLLDFPISASAFR